jgi:prepilin-type N-terminal cleavage/methylation domain-containing protein
MNKIKNKKGFSLVETITVIVIVSIIMMTMTLFFARVFQINHFSLELGYATMVASRGVDQAVKNIRRASRGGNGAFAVESAGDTEIIFYANYDDDEAIERVRYFLNQSDDTFNVGVTQLDTTTTPPKYNYQTEEVVTRVANFVVNNPTNEPIFTYFNVKNEQLSSPVTATQVSMVKILLFVNVDEIKQPNNVRIESYVVMRNLSTFGQTPT